MWVCAAAAVRVVGEWGVGPTVKTFISSCSDTARKERDETLQQAKNKKHIVVCWLDIKIDFKITLIFCAILVFHFNCWTKELADIFRISNYLEIKNNILQTLYMFPLHDVYYCLCVAMYYYCFCKFKMFVCWKKHIFGGLNIPQNSSNSAHTSHLVKCYNSTWWVVGVARGLHSAP